MHPKRILLFLGVVGMMGAGCWAGNAAPTAPITPAPSSDEDHLATVRAMVLTQGAGSTAVYPTATSTPRPMATEPLLSSPPVPAIDLSVEVPYLQDGGALPPGAMKRIGVGDILEVAVYPDRSAFLLGTSTGLYVYRLDSFERIWRRYLEYTPWGISLSPDGNRIITDHGFATGPYLFDAANGNRIARLGGWYNGCWSPDGRMIAVEDIPLAEDPSEEPTTEQIQIYDAVSGAVIKTLEAPINVFYGQVFDIRWSLDGSVITATTVDGMVNQWDVSTARLLDTAEDSSGNTEPNCPGCFSSLSPDSKYRLTMENRKLVAVERASGKSRQLEIDGPIHELAWGNVRLYLVGDEAGLVVFDTNTWTQVYRSQELVTAFALSPSGQQIAFGTQTTTVLNTDTFEVAYTIPVEAESVRWSPDGGWLIDSDEGTFWKEGKPFVSLEPGRMKAVSDQYMLVSDLSRVMLVDLQARKVARGIRVNLWAKQLTWSQDGSVLTLASPGEEWYWSEASNQIIRTLPEPLSPGPSIFIGKELWRKDAPVGATESPDGKWNLSVSVDRACGDGPWGGGCGIWGGSLSLYSKGETQAITALEFPRSGPTVLALSADSRLLAVGLGAGITTLYDDRIVVLDVPTGKELFSFEGHLGDITGLVFSPNGMRLASASEDGTVIVWNTGH